MPLRQHLRSFPHRIPEHCPRCGFLCSKAALVDHMDEPCPRREFVLEGIDEGKKKEIMDKKGAEWEAVFQILFPNDPIPSRCEDRRS